jgi:cytochrome c556
MNRGITFATTGSVGLLALVLLIGCADRTPSSRAEEASATTALPAMQSDVQQLKDKAADQAHAMVSVAYHFNNMWFAAEAKNWPLAEFYWNETRSHMRWAVRIIPVRKDKAGYEIKLAEILDAMENTPLKQLQEAIAAKDHDKFVAAYRFSLETCYACHKASDKPFLRPQIPDRPAEPTINFDPQADWPK